MTQKDGSVGCFDESTNSALIAGRPLIKFDNLREKTSSTYLEAIITAGGPVLLSVIAANTGGRKVGLRP